VHINARLTTFHVMKLQASIEAMLWWLSNEHGPSAAPNFWPNFWHAFSQYALAFRNTKRLQRTQNKSITSDMYSLSQPVKVTH